MIDPDCDSDTDLGNESHDNKPRFTGQTKATPSRRGRLQLMASAGILLPGCIIRFFLERIPGEKRAQV